MWPLGFTMNTPERRPIMNQYNLIELAMVLLFGLLGGMLFYGRRGFLPPPGGACPS